MLGLFLLTSCSNEGSNLQSSNIPLDNNQSFALIKPQNGLLKIDAKDIEMDSFKTTAAAGADRGRFNISFKFLVPVTDRQLDVFEDAAARWERIIIKDVPSITATLPSAFVGAPPIIDGGTIDDIVIEVVIAPIDGPGAILGQAGPTYIRLSDGLPVAGVMFFDVEDLGLLDEYDLFEEVIVHEMGHVLGIGTLWNYGERTLLQGTASEPFFAGRQANVFWNAEGGEDLLPIENSGGRGTIFSHWRESLLRNELMTGYINLGENPLSRITAGSMGDLGYGVGVVGESYLLPRGTQGVDINDLAKTEGFQGLHIAEMELVLQPIGVVNDLKK